MFEGKHYELLRQHHAELIQNIAAHCKQHCSNVIHVVVLQQYCNHALRMSWQCSFDVGVLPEFKTDGPQSLLHASMQNYA